MNNIYRYGIVWCNALLLLGAALCSAQDNSEQCSAFAPPAVIRGKKFYDSVSGTYIPIKGVNYYPRPNLGALVETNSIDFFTEDFRTVWERDIVYFKELNVNVVRVYAVNPGLNHDGFMCALQAAGIYLIVGLAAQCQDCAITKDAAPDCYPAALKTRGEFIISEFARYDNVLAFSAGNEVSLVTGTLGVNEACQKKFIRDMRAFIQKCSSTVRHIPIGLAIADIDREIKALYYGCRSDPDDELENSEFIGINLYLHCDGSLTSSDPLVGFETLLADFASYGTNVPVILTEFGCNNPSFPTIDGYIAQRNFLQVDTLFSQRFRNEFAGGVVFEYSTEDINSQSKPPFTVYGDGNFGIGFFEPDDCDDIDIPCKYVPFPQFDTLAEKYAAVDTTDEPGLEDYVDTEKTLPVCPSQYLPLSSFTWASAEIEDLACPSPVFVFCPGVPAECSNLGILLPPPTQAPTANVEPTSTLMSSSPSNAPRSGDNSTAVPTTQPSVEPTSTGMSSFNPSNAPSTGDKDTEVPTTQPSIEPTSTDMSSSNPSNAPSTGDKDTEVPTTQPSGSPESNSNAPSLVNSSSNAPSAFPSSAPSQETPASSRSFTPQPSDTERLVPTSSAGRCTGWHWFAFASLFALLKC